MLIFYVIGIIFFGGWIVICCKVEWLVHYSRYNLIIICFSEGFSSVIHVYLYLVDIEYIFSSYSISLFAFDGKSLHGTNDE